MRFDWDQNWDEDRQWDWEKENAREKEKENVALIHDSYGWPPTTHRANIWPGPL
jgi:hypothetical protein